MIRKRAELTDVEELHLRAEERSESGAERAEGKYWAFTDANVAHLFYSSSSYAGFLSLRTPADKLTRQCINAVCADCSAAVPGAESVRKQITYADGELLLPLKASRYITNLT